MTSIVDMLKCAFCNNSIKALLAIKILYLVCTKLKVEAILKIAAMLKVVTLDIC